MGSVGCGCYDDGREERRMRGFKYEDSGHTMDGAVVYQYIHG